jgi:hypothetical protein
MDKLKETDSTVVQSLTIYTFVRYDLTMLFGKQSRKAKQNFTLKIQFCTSECYALVFFVTNINAKIGVTRLKE